MSGPVTEVRVRAGESPRPAALPDVGAVLREALERPWRELAAAMRREAARWAR